jgi:hypothetical protein
MPTYHILLCKWRLCPDDSSPIKVTHIKGAIFIDCSGARAGIT